MIMASMLARKEDVLIVPLKVFRGRLVVGPGRFPQAPAMKQVVLLAVVEFLVDPPTDFDAVVRRDGEVATVEQPVEIAAQKKSIVDAVPTFGRIGPDMRCLKNRKNLLPGDGTPALVRVCNQNAEGSLAQSRAHLDRIPIARWKKFLHLKSVEGLLQLAP